jgi:integrase
MKHIRFHDLRHTAATLMLKHKIPVIVVSRRLGHAQPSITLDIYGHLLPGMQEEAAQLMDEIMIPIALEIAPKLPQKPIKKEPLDKRGSKS